MTITDNDLIEKSNLNRQFLFRPHHIQVRWGVDPILKLFLKSLSWGRRGAFFPRFRRCACYFFASCDFSFCSVWPFWLLSFWFYDTRNALLRSKLWKFLNTYLYNREKCPERSGRYQASLRQDAMYEKMSRLSAGFLNLLTICLE